MVCCLWHTDNINKTNEKAREKQLKRDCVLFSHCTLGCRVWWFLKNIVGVSRWYHSLFNFFSSITSFSILFLYLLCHFLFLHQEGLHRFLFLCKLTQPAEIPTPSQKQTFRWRRRATSECGAEGCVSSTEALVTWRVYILNKLKNTENRKEIIKKYCILPGDNSPLIPRFCPIHYNWEIVLTQKTNNRKKMI